MKVLKLDKTTRSTKEHMRERAKLLFVVGFFTWWRGFEPSDEVEFVVMPTEAAVEVMKRSRASIESDRSKDSELDRPLSRLRLRFSARPFTVRPAST